MQKICALLSADELLGFELGLAKVKESYPSADIANASLPSDGTIYELVSNYNTLITDGCQMIIGPPFSSHVTAVEPIATQVIAFFISSITCMCRLMSQ